VAAVEMAPAQPKKVVATKAEETPQEPLKELVITQTAEISPQLLNQASAAEPDPEVAPDVPPEVPVVAEGKEVVVAAAAPRKKNDIRAVEREPVEITVEDSAAEIVIVPPAETPPETPAAAPEEVVIIADAAPTEPLREPVVATVAEIAEPVMEQAEIPKQTETAPQQPLAETVVAALESEPVPVPVPVSEPEPAPVVEETPARAADLSVEEAPSEAEVEWARIDAVLDESGESQSPGALAGEDAAKSISIWPA